MGIFATKWVIFFGIVFLIGTLASGIAEYAYLGPQQIGTFEHLMTDWQVISFSNPLVALGTFVQAAWSYVKILFGMLTWNYACFYGAWALFRIFGIAISVGFAVGIVLTVVRG